MKRYYENIYEELISDNSFIQWALKYQGEKNQFWSDWEKNHPEYKKEFNEALKTVRLFRFRNAEISDADIKYSWQKICKQIDNSNKKIKKEQILFWVNRVAAILFIPLVVSVIWLYQKNMLVKSAYKNIIEYNEVNPITVKAPLGGILNLQLPDGSKVWLNAGSELKYPAKFNAEEREVNIIGEAFFEVEKDEVPFVVNNIGPQVRVYGTHFNVNAYNNEENIIVALEDGKVSLMVNGQEQFLKPGEISVFNKKKRIITIKKSEIDQFTSWRSGKIIFRDASLAYIARTLERRYNADITIADPEVANYTYNAIIRGETFEQILELLSLSAPIKYTYIKPEQNNDSTFSSAKVVIMKDKNRIIKQ